MRARPVLVMAGLASILHGCGTAAVVPLTPEGEAVQVEKQPAPPGSRNLGPVDASNGRGCGLFAARGSYDGAVADLRNRAAEVGGNYVQIETVTEPHDESGCTTGGYAIRGVVFFVSRGPAAQPEAPEPPRPGVCNPPCSPGFACRNGACIPVCNPPCEATEVCTRRRTCEPAGGAPGPVVADGGGAVTDARTD